jgi:hypothetical protein
MNLSSWQSSRQNPNLFFLVRSASLVLALFLLLEPLAPVLAEEEQAAEQTSTTSEPVQASPVVIVPAGSPEPEPGAPDTDVEFSALGEESGDTQTTEPEKPAAEEPEPTEGEGESQSMMMGGSANGSDRGQLQQGSKINQQNGALSYDYSIVVPPGRNGMQPNLALIYNSSAGSDSDIFGHGWSMNLPYVERVNKTGSEPGWRCNEPGRGVHLDHEHLQ